MAATGQKRPSKPPVFHGSRVSHHTEKLLTAFPLLI
jgi:hypothetical protein